MTPLRVCREFPSFLFLESHAPLSPFHFLAGIFTLNMLDCLFQLLDLCRDNDGEVNFEELMEHALFLEGCHSTLAWSLLTGSAVFFNLDDAHKPPPFLETFSAGLISGAVSRTLTVHLKLVHFIETWNRAAHAALIHSPNC